MTRFGYDTARRMLTMTDPRGGVTTNTYDASSRVVTQDDPMGRRTRFDYTTTPGATRITHPRGNVEIQAYTNGVLTAVTKGAGSAEAATWRYAYEHATLASTSVTDPNGNTTTSTYDLAGNLTSSTDGLGRTSRFTYDTLNDVTSATDPLGITTTFTYDAKGNLLSRSRPLTSTSQAQVVRFGYDPARPGDVTSVTDPNGAVWRFSYDAQGNLTRSTDPLGNATTHGYDGIGRKTSSVAPKGNAAGANPATYTTRYAYDAFGDMTSITDPLGNSTAMAYDPNRNLVRHTDANGRATAFAFNAADERTGVTRADNTTLGSGYDGNGNLVRQTDGGGRSTTYTYDAQDRLKTMADPLGRTTSYSYDGAGNRTSLTDPQGQVTTFAYDAADQLTDILYSSDGTPDVFFAYDDNGRRVQMSDGTGTKGVGINLYAYDSLNRLVQHVNGNGQVVRYGYDLKGQLSTLTYPNGLSVTRAFDAAGRMTSVSDWLGNTTTFAYDPNANLTTTKFPVPGADYRDTFTYDAADQLMGVTDTADGFVYANFGYTRDNLGQLTSVSPTGTSQGPETYGYTALNQLASVNGAPYSYDAADNLTRLASGATQSYDAANQLTSLVDPAAGTTTFGYDQRGNRTSTTDAAGNQTFYSYDQANRLDFWDSGALTLYPFGRRITTFADYSYDGDGLRSMKKQGGAPEAVQLFAWNMAEGLPTLLTDGTASYIYGPDGLPLEQIGADSAASFFHHDQLGSTRLLTDPAGIILADFDYDAYGQLTDSRGLALTPFGFAGEYTDAETGFQYLRARYYDPATGQFVTRDPITAITRDPYRYGSGNPINSIDPTGLYNAETGWCNRIQAIKHPSRIHRCKLVKRLADEATAETEDRYPESLADGQGDAFRHCMWSATMTVFLGPRDAKGFGDRHERANLQEGGSKKSSKMDQFNNRIGRRIGREAEANSPCRNAAVAAAIRRCHAAAAMGGELRLKP